MKWYFKALGKYASFSGRARRKELWMFYLFNLMFFLLSAFADSFFGYAGVDSIGIISIGYMILTILPTIALQVRRLHDLGKKGSMFFVILIPVIGALWLLVLYCTEGEPKDNEYGVNPKS